MLYIGMDVHSKWMTIKGFNPDTADTFVVNRKAIDEQSLHEYFSSLNEELHGVMESGTNSWAVYRILEPYFERLIVVDPATVWGKDVRRGAKTDGRDALGLAMKMQRGELSPLYVPDVKTQDLRALTRAKINASRHVTKLVNELGSQMRSWGIIIDGSLLSVKGQMIIEQSKATLPEYSLIVLEMWLKMLKMAQDVEAELEKKVEIESAKDEVCQLLMSIPGVGPLTSLVVKAEVGDINRFSRPEQLINYCGLCPSVRQSSEHIHYGKLSRLCNKFLKYVLILRAQGMSRSKTYTPMRQTYWRVIVKGKNHAKIAVSRQLARTIYSMLKNRTPWNPDKTTHRVS
jgi:transposase